ASEEAPRLASGRAPLQFRAMYRAASVPPTIPDAPEPEAIADELRERAQRLTRWLDRAGFAVAILTGAAVFWLVHREGHPARLAYLVTAFPIILAERAAARW